MVALSVLASRRLGRVACCHISKVVLRCVLGGPAGFWRCALANHLGFKPCHHLTATPFRYSRWAKFSDTKTFFALFDQRPSWKFQGRRDGHSRTRYAFDSMMIRCRKNRGPVLSFANCPKQRVQNSEPDAKPLEREGARKWRGMRGARRAKNRSGEARSHA